MTDLTTFAMDAHGGLDRWRQLKTVSARLVQGGVLWQLKGQNGVLDDVHVTVDLRKEWASHRPFGQPDRRSAFQPDRVAIETSNGDVLEERANPRESFRGHKFDTPWDSLQLAYFAGYAMWTYLNTPFLFALPGVKTKELESWKENGEAWRRLRVTFPERVATHSAEQTFYFDRQGLLKRHDYERARRVIDRIGDRCRHARDGELPDSLCAKRGLGSGASRLPSKRRSQSRPRG